LKVNLSYSIIKTTILESSCRPELEIQSLSGLLEENLHSSARKDDLALDLKRKEREMRETVGIYNQQVSELEATLEQETKSKDTVQSKISELQTSMENFENQKITISSEVTSCDRSTKMPQLNWRRSNNSTTFPRAVLKQSSDEKRDLLERQKELEDQVMNEPIIQ
jgi:chromosome segregation ATPase